MFTAWKKCSMVFVVSSCHNQCWEIMFKRNTVPLLMWFCLQRDEEHYLNKMSLLINISQILGKWNTTQTLKTSTQPSSSNVVWCFGVVVNLRSGNLASKVPQSMALQVFLDNVFEKKEFARKPHIPLKIVSGKALQKQTASLDRCWKKKELHRKFWIQALKQINTTRLMVLNM